MPPQGDPSSQLLIARKQTKKRLEKKEDPGHREKTRLSQPPPFEADEDAEELRFCQKYLECDIDFDGENCATVRPP